jgi:hypothetical protein
LGLTRKPMHDKGRRTSDAISDKGGLSESAPPIEGEHSDAMNSTASPRRPRPVFRTQTKSGPTGATLYGCRTCGFKSSDPAGHPTCRESRRKEHDPMTTTSGADEFRTMVHQDLIQKHVRSDAAANALAPIDFAAVSDFTGSARMKLVKEIADALPSTAFEEGSPERERRYLREMKVSLAAQRAKEATGGTGTLDERLARRTGGNTALAERLSRRTGGV